jgi:hypothetical protein
MKRIAVLALMVAGLSGSALCQYSAEFSSYYSGKRYDFRITPEQLSSTPAWLDGELNPPLSARSAKDIAAVYLSDLFKNASAWSVGEIVLYPVAERWVYLISFGPPPPRGCYDCMSTPFKIAVLMDGVAVMATKSRWNPPTPSVRIYRP